MTRKAYLGIGTLVLCLGLLLTRSYHPLYDMEPTSGDETMSLVQAMNSFRLGTPGYGWTALMTPWTAGLFTLPIYFLVYGPVILCVPPLQRIAAARVCSRVLMGTALFLTLLLLWRALRAREQRDRLDGVVVAALGLGLVWLFGFSENFLFVASFARVDALAALGVCAFQLVAATFLAQPTERRLMAVGLMVFAVAGCSHLAGALCACDAIVLGVWRLLTPPSRGRLAQVLRAVIIVAAASFAAFALINLVVWRHDPASTANVAMRGEMADIGWRATHVSLLSLRIVRDLPGLFPAVCFVLGGSLLLLMGKARPFVLGLVRLASLLLVTWVVFVIERGVYTPFLMLAILLPCLDQLVRHGEPRLLRMIVAGTFPLLVLFSIAGPVPDGAADEQRRHMNAYRDAHVRSTLDFLEREHATNAITTDPLFLLLDDRRHTYYFLYEVYAAPEEEHRVGARFLHRFGIRHLITTPFGESGWIRQIGFPHVNQSTQAHPVDDEPFVVRYADQSGFRLQRRFVSRAAGFSPQAEYRYGDRPSTPITVFEVEDLPR